MTIAIIAAVHIYSAALAVAIFFMRFHHLRQPLDDARLKKVFFWDNLSLLVILVLMGTGLWRLFAGLEKPTEFYLQSSAFWWKMGLLGFGWMMEMPIMVTLIRWRIDIGKGKSPNTDTIHRFRYFEIVEGLGFPAIVVVSRVTRPPSSPEDLSSHSQAR